MEASLKGDTVEQAAANDISLQLAGAESVAQTAALLDTAFEWRTGRTACRTAASSVQKQTAECSSAAEVGRALGTLSGILRFGSIRRLDTSSLPELMEKLFLRFCLCLPSGAVCDRPAAEQLITAVSAVNDACTAHDFMDGDRFTALLSDIADSNFAAPLLSGFCCAVLMERGLIAPGKLSELIGRRLSPGFAAEGAAVVEGFSKKQPPLH